MNTLYTNKTNELIETLQNSENVHNQLRHIVRQFKQAFDSGHKVLVAGNGGSAAQAQHLSDEMVGRYKNDRPAYPVIALSADGAVVTCIGNDYGFANIFSRQVEALGEAGDVFVGLTTSGTSENILNAAQTARGLGMTIVAFTGENGTFKDTADYPLIAPSKTGARIQEVHLHSIHLLCEEFENN